MEAQTHKQRWLNALNGEPVDMLACHDGLWGETTKKYVKEGKLVEEEDAILHFDTSLRSGGWLNAVADLDFEAEILEETDETILNRPFPRGCIPLEPVTASRIRHCPKPGP